MLATAFLLTFWLSPCSAVHVSTCSVILKPCLCASLSTKCMFHPFPESVTSVQAAVMRQEIGFFDKSATTGSLLQACFAADELVIMSSNVQWINILSCYTFVLSPLISICISRFCRCHRHNYILCRVSTKTRWPYNRLLERKWARAYCSCQYVLKDHVLCCNWFRGHSPIPFREMALPDHKPFYKKCNVCISTCWLHSGCTW